jgi:uncharacterized integral membrane protein
MSKIKSPLVAFLATVLVIILISLLGPEEQSLGANVRIVYLHGAWVLTAEIAFFAAAIAGLIGLLAHFISALKPREEGFNRWSAALGRTGIVFWVTYLPLSLWAMETNWNGLFLAEPRFRLALTFAVAGVLLQVGLWIIHLPWLTSLANILFIVALRVVFSTASNIMHPPPSPIFNSGNWLIIGFFIVLNLLTLLAAYFLTRWFLTLNLSHKTD